MKLTGNFNTIGEKYSMFSDDVYYVKYSREKSLELRMDANTDYTLAETSKETAEGTATYVRIKASKMVGYDYGVMYFDNAKNVSFGDVFTEVDAGKVQRKYLNSRMPYETGALLCEMLDAMHAPNWQQTLNQQTLKSPATLYTVIKSNVE